MSSTWLCPICQGNKTQCSCSNYVNYTSTQSVPCTCGTSSGNCSCKKQATYCNEGCLDITNADCVHYTGDRLNCIKVNNNDSIKAALCNINNEICAIQESNGKLKVDAADTCPNDLVNKIEAGANLIITPVGTGCDRKLKLDAVLGAGASIPDEKVKVSNIDTTSGFLFDKFTTSDCITWVKTSIGLNEKLKAEIDWACVLSKLQSLPQFCDVIKNCNIAPQVCGTVSGVNKQNGTSNTLTISWLPGANAVSYIVKLFSDAGYVGQVGSTQNTSGNSVIFTGLNTSTNYWVTVQSVCSSSTSTPFGAGPYSTSAVASSSCPSIILNTPIIVTNSMSISWTGGVGATAYNVYIDNVLQGGGAQASTTFTANNLTNGSHTIKVEALPCTGNPQSDNKQFEINYNAPCVAPIAPTGVAGPLVNSCPDTTINLTAAVTSYPSGSSVEWHSNNNTLSSTLVATPTAITNSGTYYAFSKNDSTGCYSATSYSVQANVTTCAINPTFVANCSSMSVQSGSFVVGLPSTGVLRIPITVSVPGTVYFTISGGGFSSPATAVAITLLTTYIDIPVSFDGTGASGNHIVNLSSALTPTASAILACSGNVNVSCPPCVLNTGDVTMTGVTISGFTINVANLAGGSYDLVIYNGAAIVATGTNLTGSYLFNAGVASTTYTVSVTKKCICGNTSNSVSINQATPTPASVTWQVVGGVICPSQQGVNFTVQLGSGPSTTNMTIGNNGVLNPGTYTINSIDVFGGAINCSLGYNVVYNINSNPAVLATNGTTVTVVSGDVISFTITCNCSS
jgi:hypothetical protein